MGALLFSEPTQNEEDPFFCTYSFNDSWIIEETIRQELPIQLETNSTLFLNKTLHTRNNALCEFTRNGQIIRIGAKSIFSYGELNHYNLNRGSMLLYLAKPNKITIESELSKLTVDGRFTAIVDCTSNGGFKFIPLEGKGRIIPDEGNSTEIYRGRLTMILGSPSQLGSAYDIDLLLLLKSSRLINSFPTALPSMKRISLSIYAQQLRLKGKFNALIGDAPTDDNLQMWAFGEEGTK